MFLQAPKSPLN